MRKQNSWRAGIAVGSTDILHWLLLSFIDQTNTIFFHGRPCNICQEQWRGCRLVADKGDEQSYIKSWMWLMLLSVRIDNRIYGPRYITFPPKQYTTTSLTTSYEFCSLSKTQLMHITGAYPEMFLMEASY